MSWPRDTAKLERVRALMAQEGVDTLVVRSPDNVLYLSNYWPMKGYDVAVLGLEGEPTLFVMEPQFEEAQRTAWTEDIRPFPFYDPDDPRPPAVRAQERCVEFLRERDRGRVGLESSQGTQAADRMVGERSDLLDLALDAVAGAQVQRGGVLAEAGDAGDGAGRDDVAGAVAERRVVGDDLGDRHRHVARVRLLAGLPVDAQFHPQLVRVTDLLRRHDPRPERAEAVDRLAEGEDAGAHLAALDVARGDVVEDRVAGDVGGRLVLVEVAARLADDHRELELVVELLGQVLGVDDRVLGADDRVDVLEEHDPRRDLVRPVDGLGLLLVLAEVAGGVEELLRDDRRAQAHVGQRDALAGGRVGGRLDAAVEQRAHVRHVEQADLLALEHADAGGAVGALNRDQLHAATPQMSAATSA